MSYLAPVEPHRGQIVKQHDDRTMGKTLKLLVATAVLLLCAPNASGQSGITFSFDRLEVTSQGISFDVTAHVGDGQPRLGDSQIYINYSTSAFGTRVREAGRIEATLGSALVDSEAYGAPILNDNGDGRVSLTAPFEGQSDEGVTMGTEPLVLLHITMQPDSDEEEAQISFDEALMADQQYTSDLETAFDDVSADGILNVDLTGLLSPVLAATTAGAGTVQLDWSATVDEGGFEVEHAEGPDGEFRAVARVHKPVDGTRFLHRVDGLELGMHRFRVRQVDASGNATYSEPVEITVELAEAFLLDPVYPNPFNPQATVRFAVKEAEPVRIELYNALGQRLQVLYDDTPQANTYQEVTIDGSGLAGGLYIVRLQGSSFAATERVTLVK